MILVTREALKRQIESLIKDKEFNETENDRQLKDIRLFILIKIVM